MALTSGTFPTVHEPSRAVPAPAKSLTVLFAAGTVMLNACSFATRAGPPGPADSLHAQTQMQAVLTDHFTHLQRIRPEVAAWAGGMVFGLPDVSQDRVKSDAQFARAAINALDMIDVRALTEDDYVSWLTLRWEMEALSSWPAFHWTSLQDVTPGDSPLDVTARVLDAQRIGNRGDALHFRRLVEGVEGLVNAIRKSLADRAARGVRISALVAPRAATHVRSFIAPAGESPFGLPATFSVNADSAWHVSLRQAVTDVVDNRINVALESLARFLEGAYAQNAPTAIGLSQYPGGRQHYAALLRYHSTLDITPEDAHAIGLREVARLAVRAREAGAAARLPGDRDSLRAALRTDPRFAAMETDSETNLLATAARLYEESAHRLDSLFRPEPSSPVSIGPLTPTRGMLGPLVTYEPPSVPDPVARYRINIERLRRRSLIELQALVFEDLMPGLHHLLAPQRERSTLPASRRAGWHGGFVRGWEVYALVMADSVVDLEPVSRFGARLRELAHACGLVVDTGINALGWTRDDAMAFLRDRLPWDDHELEGDFVVVAAERPGELAAATLGAREFIGMRRWVQQELGNRFDLAAFHGEVLRIGSVPLPVLGAHLERWIWDEKQRAARQTPNVPPPPELR